MEKQRLKQKQLEERRKNQEDDIMKSNLSEAEKNRLLKEHDENMEKLEENLREEQERYVNYFLNAFFEKKSCYGMAMSFPLSYHTDKLLRISENSLKI